MRIRDFTARMISTSWRCAEESSSPIRPRGRTRSKPYSASSRATICVEPAAVDEGAATRQLAGEDVLGHVDARDDLGLLVDDPDAGGARLAGIGEAKGLPVDRQAARVGLVVAVEDLQERGLAGAVLAQEGEHLAGPHVERDVIERLDVGKGLADTADLEDAGTGPRARLRRFGRRGQGHAVADSWQVRCARGLDLRPGPRAPRQGSYCEQLPSEISSKTSA